LRENLYLQVKVLVMGLHHRLQGYQEVSYGWSFFPIESGFPDQGK
jgi:hypothetical protein